MKRVLNHWSGKMFIHPLEKSLADDLLFRSFALQASVAPQQLKRGVNQLSTGKGGKNLLFVESINILSIHGGSRVHFTPSITLDTIR